MSGASTTGKTNNSIVQFALTMAGVIPDTPKSRLRIREVIEEAMLREGVAVQVMVVEFRPISGVQVGLGVGLEAGGDGSGV